VSPAFDAGTEPPSEDVLAARKPHVVGRHRLRGVLGDQRSKSIDVVGLERTHVAPEQFFVDLRVAVTPGLDASVARARCSALFTDGTLVSSSSAASLACHCSTSGHENAVLRLLVWLVRV